MVALSHQLAQAYAPGINTRKIDSDTPPGRLNMRAVLAETQRPRTTGRKPKAFKRTVRTQSPKAQLEIAFMGDVSGSMGQMAESLAVTRWMVTGAGKRVQARVSGILFGHDLYPVQRPGTDLDDIEVYGCHDANEQSSTAWAFWVAKTGILQHKERKGVVVWFSDFYFVNSDQSKAFMAVVNEARRAGIVFVAAVPKAGYEQYPAQYGVTNVIIVDSGHPDITAKKLGAEILKAVKQS